MHLPVIKLSFMRSAIISFAAAMLLFNTAAFAQEEGGEVNEPHDTRYFLKLKYSPKSVNGEWLPDGIVYGPWVNNGEVYDCIDTPDPTQAMCSYTQERTVSQRERHSGTHEVRLVDTYYEYQSFQAGDYIVDTVYGDWSEWWFDREGHFYECGEFTPDLDLMPLYEEVTMTRTCLDDYFRAKYNEHIWFSGRITMFDYMEETDRRNTVDTYVGIGRKDYIVETRLGEWQEQNVDKNCNLWKPDVGSRTNYDTFTQQRSCEVDRSYLRVNSDIWRSGMIVPAADADTNRESKTERSSEVESRPVVVNLTSWYSDKQTNCSAWLPEVADQTDSFVQTMTCDDEQFRTAYYIADVYPSEVIRQVRETQLVDDGFVNTRMIYVGYYEYFDVGAPYDCTSWAPLASSYDLGVLFTQSQTCKQNMQRNRAYSTGQITPEYSTKTIERNKPAYGSRVTGDPLESTIYGEWSSWQNVGFGYGCSDWTPSTYTVAWGVQFTQTSTCSQDQRRTRSVTYVYQSGKTETAQPEVDTQTIADVQTQEAWGYLDEVIRTEYTEWTPWTDNGSAFDCGVYTPEASSIDVGVEFTQSANCSISQFRFRQLVDVYASGYKYAKSTDYAYQTAETIQQRTEVGTRTVAVTVIGNEVGPWGDWVNVGDVSACGEWTPDPSTVQSNLLFKQSANCSQLQKRSRSIYDVWSDNSRTLNREETSNQTLPVVSVRDAYGTKVAPPLCGVYSYEMGGEYGRNEFRIYTYDWGDGTYYEEREGFLGNYSTGDWKDGYTIGEFIESTNYDGGYGVAKYKLCKN